MFILVNVNHSAQLDHFLDLPFVLSWPLVQFLLWYLLILSLPVVSSSLSTQFQYYFAKLKCFIQAKTEVVCYSPCSSIENLAPRYNFRAQKMRINIFDPEMRTPEHDLECVSFNNWQWNWPGTAPWQNTKLALDII